THAIILPSYSTWFDMNMVHEIERKAMAEFFNSRNRSKTPVVYKDYRDFMINTYRLNPAEYLTVTACRRNLAGDVCAIMRVHAFLEQWGLINYQVDGDHRPSNIGPPYTGHFKVICDTPRGLQAFQPSADQEVTKGKQSVDTDNKASAAQAAKGDSKLEVSRNIYDGDAKSTNLNATTEVKTNGETPTTNGVSASKEASTGPITKVNCHACAVDCTRLYYHAPTKEGSAKAKYEICPSCFLDGHFPGDSSKSQYTRDGDGVLVRQDNPTYTTVPERDAPWSDAELLRLLEALERYDEEWTDIAEHVGTRTREECALQFLQLGIEDKYLESELTILGAHGDKQIPYNQADNPVMSVVGFLASLADPATTAAAAHSSADEMKRRLRNRLEGGESRETEASNGKGKERDGDAMEVDVEQETTTTTVTTTTVRKMASIPLATTGARAVGLATEEEPETTISRDEDDGEIGKDAGDEPDADAAVTGTEVEGQEGKTKESVEAAARDHLISQTHAIILPSYSTWFDMNMVHDIERKAMAEFFNSRNRSKTPVVYKDYRDFMINTYRLNPAEYLTVTACRRNLAGDVCAIMRVHAFLEQWGLINYQVDGDHRPSNIGPPYTGHFKVICDTPRGLQAFQPSADEEMTKGKQSVDTDKKASAAQAAKGDSKLEVSRNIYDGDAKSTNLNATTEVKTNGETPTTNGVSANKEASTGPITKVNCHACAVDCTRLYYHAPTKEGSAKAKYEICPSCFLDGHFPGDSSKSQYTRDGDGVLVRQDNPTYTTVPERDAPWSDAELLRLLEALERYDEEWTDIAEHVGTRTREECALQFLQLNIEDKYLESELTILGAHGDKQIPYNQADNPVMSVVGFLASLADPATTAAAAHSSAEEMKRRLRNRLEGGESRETEASNGKGKERDGDAMEVDVYGWSQVIDDGFGIAYMINENSINFNIVSKGLGSQRMSFYLNEAAGDMRDLLISSIETPKAKL
ncbi:hypothetical protein BN1723_017522, partial [Verticillium longisporum]